MSRSLDREEVSDFCAKKDKVIGHLQIVLWGILSVLTLTVAFCFLNLFYLSYSNGLSMSVMADGIVILCLFTCMRFINPGVIRFFCDLVYKYPSSKRMRLLKTFSVLLFCPLVWIFLVSLSSIFCALYVEAVGLSVSSEMMYTLLSPISMFFLLFLRIRLWWFF
ncbi:MAG: hypothetical protein ACI9S8_000317 [Chlamydiales bacterium]|jgi:hypothetical protein